MSSQGEEPIAIIGSACRFAGSSTTPSELWSLLRDPVSLRGKIPPSRFNADAFYHPEGTHHGHMNVLHSYLLDEDPRVFDAEFFAINPLEARAMDPQQRMLLEVVYETLESGGLSMEALKGSDTAVFAGLMCGDYEAMLLRDLDQAPTYFAVGTSRAVLSNRISYFFDWHGASVTVDTACSSSLVAVHQAVQALRSGDSRMAIACGSNLILGPEMYIIESKLKMLSPDGLSRMWDKDANGYARGEGVAAVALKTLSQALADGDHIHAIIRGTGVNQDGATTGLTMPSAQAQKTLIHSVYRKAGLDPTKPGDQPQYIEAHGTGTPAGDPVEAEALSTAFFPSSQPASQPIYTGSIKTVLGHTEGTAGIAALLKVVQALRHATIPPNLLFNELSPKVAPFYGNVQIPTQAMDWPSVPAGQPRRASINNFGFGGTNAHAIVESYPDLPDRTSAEPSGQAQDPIFTPFVFSAASEQSLRSNLSAFADYLSHNPDTDMHALAHTLRDRRSQLAYRAAFEASTLSELGAIISQRLSDNTDVPLGTRGLRRRAEAPRILGVFTGQGTQYARMGAELVQRSPFAENIIKSLDQVLASLPEEDRPTWTLHSQMVAEESTSRVGEAAVSQPLCAAVQILLVDILRAAGVHFAAVVGHSSGEIAAAYAAGYLSARDAIIIAYYRGFHCKLAQSPNGDVKGAMMAVGTTLEDAMDLCSAEEFAGRVGVAACNSASSVTISGDEDAMDEVAAVLADEEKFHRRLRVDQAYHSAHMLPCSAPYVASLRRAGVEVQAGSPGCTWFSSVRDGQPIDQSAEDDLGGIYWAQNMVKPVLFSQAVTAAISSSAAFDAVLEVGPHPSLAGPATQTIDAVLGRKLAYHGVLDRKRPATAALSACLGFLWSHLDGTKLRLGACETALSPASDLARRRFRVLPDLPRYQWNHATQHWAESRRSRRIRARQDPFHELLGNLSPDSAPHVLRWHNVLRPAEMPWLAGHQVQRQIVLPAAAYVASAVEAARILVRDRSVRLVELSGFHIHNAIMFGDDGGVEVQIELSDVREAAAGGSISARFTYSAATGGSSADLVLAADGHLEVSLGEPSTTLLPPRAEAPPHMIPVEPERLYDFMQGLEYDFSGAFRSLTKMERKLGKAVCVGQKAAAAAGVAGADALLLHPIDLDAAFQSAILAYSYPGDDQLRRLHLPTTIQRVTVNPAVLASAEHTAGSTLALDSRCTAQDMASPGSGFSGSVAVYAPGCAHAAVQVERLQFLPVGSDASHDRDVFYKTHWLPAKPDGTLASAKIPITEADRDLMFVLSRIAAYYLRVFDTSLPEDHQARVESPLCHYLNYARYMTGLLKSGEHKWARVEWLQDTEQDVFDFINEYGYADNSDVRIMLLVGSVMPRVFRGETTMLEHFRESGLLDEYYSHGFGTRQCTMWVAGVLEQITNTNPHLSVLEVGAGTGGATKRILGTIGGDSVGSYTFTDISSSFFENAAGALGEWQDKLVFKVFNAEVDPVAQGFKAGSYDVVVAFMVVHACARLDEAVANLRRLLKPGGLLVLGEGASDGAMQAGAGFIFGTLPGWWRGVDEGRTLSPLVSADEWQSILRGAGFSGIDTISPPSLFDAFGITLFVSTAVDDRVAFLREPLASETASIRNKSPLKDGAVILGGLTFPVSKLVEDLTATLSAITSKLTVFKTLEEADTSALGDGRLVISLVDLETPVFKDITPERWAKFRKLWEQQGHILWLTSGRLTEEPYCNMTVGFARSAVHELDGLHAQFLDVPSLERLSARAVAEAALRWVAPELDGGAVLYTKEPEVIFDERACELVPRLFTIKDANDRLNSTTRPILHRVDAQKSIVELVQQLDSGAHLRELSRYETCEALVPQPVHAGGLELRTTHTVALAVRTLGGYQFLVCGVDPQGQRYLGLVSSPRSMIKMPLESAQSIDASTATESHLVLVAAELVALNIVDQLFAGQKLMVHNAPEPLAQAIKAHADSKNITLIFTTHDSNNSLSVPHIILNPYASRSTLAELLLPSDIASFASFSPGSGDKLEQKIMSLLPSHCRKETRRTLFAHTGTAAGAPQAVFDELLVRAIAGAQSLDAPPTSTTSLESFVNGEAVEDELLLVLDWAAETLPARVSRIEATQLFKSDKTYWLVGLSGALGISLCDWMIARGVRYLVLTSRNPKIDERWIQDHQSRGVVIEILLCDVTDEPALQAVHQTIVDTMPPIVGLLNGAMVLRDVSVPNMDHSHVADVIRPKVLGSIHLDRIFYNVDLDFFVLLSSINCIIGNVGQANYAAANMGMIGVAGQRRKRGLRSSVVNVGAIIGVGYITQSARQLDVTVAKAAMMHLSEQDFHQIFAECMEAGHLDNAAGPEISTGLLRVPPDSINIPPWYSDPRFTRFRIQQAAGAKDSPETAESASTQDLLRACRTLDDVASVVKAAFGAQLRRTIQVSTSDDDLMTMRGLELGFDSLISVDLRSWFFKTFQVSIPVLKIMANDVQMSSLVEVVVDGLPGDMTPAIQRADASTDDEGDSKRADSLPDSDSPVTTPDSETAATALDAKTVDWDAETFAPEPEDPALYAGAAPPKPRPEVILLTGCSGLLGHHLLNHLLAEPQVRKVVCVAVRRLQNRLESGDLPQASDRLVYYEGDLTSPCFGLSHSEWTCIFREVDAVVHNGSDTSHLKYYSALRRANVQSTRQIISACLPRRIPVHYVSSAGVALFVDAPEFPEVSCTTTGKRPPRDGSHGYMCGKWVCESMLERVHARHSLPVVIQRPSTIIRAGDDAAVARAEFDWVNALLHYAHATRAVPRIDHNAGAFDLVEVETCCRDVVRELRRDADGAAITYVNNVGDEVIPMNRMADLGLKRAAGRPYEVLPMDKWIEKVVEAGMHPAVAALIETFDEPGVDKYPRLLRERKD